jgi:hypothetical protein
MIQITSDYFCAAVIVEHERVVSAAPILYYMVGWTVDRVMWYCDKKQWKYKTVANPVEE